MPRVVSDLRWRDPSGRVCSVLTIMREPNWRKRYPEFVKGMAAIIEEWNGQTRTD